MSDIQEEMKRLYMKAIEKDLERSSTNNLVVGRIIKLEEENKELQNIINKAIEYINNNSLYEEEYDYDYEENIHLSGINDTKARNDLLNILKGDNK